MATSGRPHEHRQRPVDHLGRGRSAAGRAGEPLSRKQRLSGDGHRAAATKSWSKYCATLPDLVILDLGLPGQDGFTVCRQLRPLYDNPILILTARDNDIDHVLGLELGADDYVIKPVEPRVLMARIDALLRRSKARAGVEQQDAAVRTAAINMVARSVSLDGSAHHTVRQRIRSARRTWRPMPGRSSRARRYFNAYTGANTTASIGCWISAYRICAGNSATRPIAPSASRRSGDRVICSSRTRGEAWRVTSWDFIC